MNVILLNSSHLHVSDTHVAILGWWGQEYKYNYNVSKSLRLKILVITLQTATLVVETCKWLLCNRIIFINPSAFIGAF